jgi:hypothetical protein
LSFYETIGVGDSKIEDLELEVLCSNSTALVVGYDAASVGNQILTF